MRGKKLLAVTTVCGMFMGGTALAAGIAVDEMSIRRLGDAFSGGAADAADASILWYNPAGMTQLSRPQVVTGLAAIPHTMKYSGSVYLESGPKVEGHNKTWSGMEFIPDFYYSTPITEKLWFGAGINSPWGTGTDFDRSWVGRYQSIRSDLLTVNFIAAMAWKVNSQLSFGVGVITEYADGVIEKAVPLTGEFEDDGFFRGTGDDASFGMLGGIYYEPTQLWQLGFEYRTAIKHKLKGHMELDLPIPSHEKVKAQLAFTIPETWTLSAVHNLSPRLALKADATLTRWSSFDKLVFDPREMGSFIDSPEVQVMDWHDSWRFALGAEYQLSKRWQIRAGVAHDDSPVPNHTVTIDFAMNDYRALSFGATYLVSSDISVDFAFQHTWTSRRTIHETVLLAGVPVVQSDGEVTNRINSLGLGILWRF